MERFISTTQNIAVLQAVHQGACTLQSSLRSLRTIHFTTVPSRVSLIIDISLAPPAIRPFFGFCGFVYSAGHEKWVKGEEIVRAIELDDRRNAVGVVSR